MIAKSGLVSGLRAALGGLRSRPAAAALAVLALLLLGLELGGEGLRTALRLERAAVLEEGQLWRLVTGHLVHLGWRHVLLNLAGAALVALLFAPLLRPWQWALALLGSMAAIDVGLLLLERIDWYVGLSGVLHGAFAAGVLAALRAGGREGWLLGAFLIGKLVWEQWLGPLPLTERSAGGPVLVDSHLYGALGALLLLPGLRRRPAAGREPL